jgi:hypothetical protein
MEVYGTAFSFLVRNLLLRYKNCREMTEAPACDRKITRMLWTSVAVKAWITLVSFFKSYFHWFSVIEETPKILRDSTCGYRFIRALTSSQYLLGTSERWRPCLAQNSAISLLLEQSDIFRLLIRNAAPTRSIKLFFFSFRVSHLE